MNWTLEVIVVPVSDVERAKTFYADGMGFVVDYDTNLVTGARFVQLTPPGSGCSIIISTGLTDAVPGSLQGMQLVVRDIDAGRAELVERGVDVSEIEQVDERDGGRLMHFADPDGNRWTVQEIRARQS